MKSETPQNSSRMPRLHFIEKKKPHQADDYDMVEQALTTIVIDSSRVINTTDNQDNKSLNSEFQQNLEELALYKKK